MIIIEGTDKAGKTTFLSNLLRRFPPPVKRGDEPRVFHFGILPDDWDYCEDYINYVGPNIILDRFMDSERAYGPVYRGKVNPRLTLENMNRVYRKCSEVGALVVYCNPKMEEVISRLDREGDEFIKKREQLQDLRNNFDNVFNTRYPLELEIIDTTKEVDPDTFARIVDKSLMMERNAKAIKNLGYRGYVSPTSKYIYYTDDLDPIFTLINIFSEGPISDYSIVSSRDIENNPVNISDLVRSIPTIESIDVVGEQAQKDYTDAGNTSDCNICLNKRVVSQQLLTVKA